MRRRIHLEDAAQLDLESAEESSGGEGEASPSREPILGLSGWIAMALLTILLAFFIRTFIFQTYKIPSESMYPTLLVGDHIVVSKIGYGYLVPQVEGPVLQTRPPERGDVVVFRSTAEMEFYELEETHADHFIKRIVGLPGDTVELRQFVVYIDGVKHDEAPEIVSSTDPSVIDEHFGNYGPLTLRKDEYFVLGDNRVNSKDSRYFGPIGFADIEGRARLVYWSARPDRPFGFRTERIGKVVR
ncbi:MAG: signal peptidase I [Bdellovibrionales bacterium]|nr:signal peptidase I [Bdellovibrionales bacterium]